MALRTPLTAQPHLYIGDSTGRPLDYGRVYFGEPNKDPEFYPIDIYLDPEMTIAAAQPVRTKGGFMDVGGNLAELHAAEVIYSLKVLDQYGRQVFYKPEMYRNNVSDFLVDEITRATAAETLIAGNLTAETQRAVAAEKVIADAVVTEKDRAVAAESVLDTKYQGLSTTISSVGGGKKAYTTYDKMIAAAALPVGDPLKLPANSSVDVTNDSDGSKNGSYAYDGTIFTKAAYDPMTLVRAVDGASSALVHMQFSYYAPYVEQTNTAPASPLYIRLDAFYISRPLNVAGVNYTWAQVKTDINNPSLFVTSPSGTPDCLALVNQSLVLNLATLKFEIVGRSFSKTSEYVVVATGAFGSLVGGGMLDTWLNHRDYEVRDAYFYQDYGESDFITAHVEQSKYPVSNLFHIRLLTIRIKTRKRVIAKTWAQVKADINDPALFVTSPSGIPDCLELDNKALVYNLKTEKFYIKGRSDDQGDGYNEIVLVAATYGQMTHGIVFNWWMSKRVTKLENSGGTPSPTPSNIVKPLTSPAPKFISHGGLSALHQYMTFNSALACVEAGKYGYWGIETDMVETKDGEWVMIHDLFLSDYIVGGTGNVIDYTLAELKAMDASRLSNAYGWSDVSIMELSEFLQICVSYNITPFLEFKSTPTNAGIDKVINTIKRFMRIENCIITSLSSAVVQSIRARNKDVPLTYVSLGGVSDIQVQLVKDVGNCVMGVRYNTSDADRKKLHDADIRYTIWTVPQSYIDSGGINGASYVLTDEGIPHNFDKGILTLNYKSGDDFAGLTSAGTSTVSNKILKLTAGKAYLDVPVEDGDVVNISFEARHISGGAGSKTTVRIDGWSNSAGVTRAYTSKSIDNATFVMHSLAALNYSRGTKTIRVSFEPTAGSSVELRGLRVQKREV